MGGGCFSCQAAALCSLPHHFFHERPHRSAHRSSRGASTQPSAPAIKDEPRSPDSGGAQRSGLGKSLITADCDVAIMQSKGSRRRSSPAALAKFG
eukprot:scaffold286709_cov14-Tisochrysis_lutea.AAC.1